MRKEEKAMIVSDLLVKYADQLFWCSYCGGSGRVRVHGARLKCHVCGGTGLELLSEKDFYNRLYSLYHTVVSSAKVKIKAVEKSRRSKKEVEE